MSWQSVDLNISCVHMEVLAWRSAKSLGIILLGLWIFRANLMAICFLRTFCSGPQRDRWTEQLTVTSVDSSAYRAAKSCWMGKKRNMARRWKCRRGSGLETWTKNSLFSCVLCWIVSYLNSPWFDAHWSVVAGRIGRGFSRPISSAHSKYGENVRVLYRLC